MVINSSVKPTTVDRITPGPGASQGARRATGEAPGPGDDHDIPDPEVAEKKSRRKFTAKYKLSILKKADSCTEPGQLGVLLRREGLYSSNLTTWRRQREKGLLSALTPKKRGRKKSVKNPLADQVARLEKENRQLRDKLAKAQIIIDVQKKVSQILAMDQDQNNNEND